MGCCITIKNYIIALPGSLLGYSTIPVAKVAGLIPGQGTYKNQPMKGNDKPFLSHINKFKKTFKKSLCRRMLLGTENVHDLLLRRKIKPNQPTK